MRVPDDDFIRKLPHTQAEELLAAAGIKGQSNSGFLFNELGRILSGYMLDHEDWKSTELDWKIAERMERLRNAIRDLRAVVAPNGEVEPDILATLALVSSGSPTFDGATTLQDLGTNWLNTLNLLEAIAENRLRQPGGRTVLWPSGSNSHDPALRVMLGDLVEFAHRHLKLPLTIWAKPDGTASALVRLATLCVKSAGCLPLSHDAVAKHLRGVKKAMDEADREAVERGASPGDNWRYDKHRG